MKISILGAGNVATQLALAFKKAGHGIVEVYNRSDDAGLLLARTVGAGFTSDLTTLKPADVFIVAVKDDAITEIGELVRQSEGIVAHTSGTKSKELLDRIGTNYGIFYPLQTMTKAMKVDFKNVPVLIEGSNNKTISTLQALAKTISQNVHVVDEQQRQWIHVAAVFANNFTNHLYGISEKLLAKKALPFDVLKPLIFRSIENLSVYSPDEIQTGPAARKDFQIIDKHLQLLADDARLVKIYQVLTESIIASQSPAQP